MDMEIRSKMNCSEENGQFASQCRHGCQTAMASFEGEFAFHTAGCAGGTVFLFPDRDTTGLVFDCFCSICPKVVDLG